MRTTTPRLAYEDADATEAMRRDAQAVGARLGVGREAWLDRGAASYDRRVPAPPTSMPHG
ncbi:MULTISPECIES: hypothetical protein [Nocardioides]|uniref:hypothetical protein n=1 Tax=Nocardioides TaxID=1839 RepID=UPI0012EF5835|nr:MULTISPECIES: hypothetical protein [Nocardioides]VXB73950.1 hypothetical protein NOCARDAX2BIS_330052 [Nocardioides sp. AX2bis]